MNRTLWLAVSSMDAWEKANNFLKLKKPPDGTDMTDQVIKLDWNKDTSDRWTVGDAKPSMEAAGFDWEKRDDGQPLGEDNFRVIHARGGRVAVPGIVPLRLDVEAGEPVQHFELLERWMGPALGAGEPYQQRAGVFPVLLQPGAVFDKWPDENGLGAEMNVDIWPTVFVGPPLSDSEWWFRTVVQKIRDTSRANKKVSKNGNGDSSWYQWRQDENPDLGVGEEIWMFERNANGDPFPMRDRMTFAV